MKEGGTNKGKTPTRRSGIILCKDMPGVNLSADPMRIEKKEGERGLNAFTRWLKEQANGWCESGVCSKGQCRGSFKNLQVRLISETNQSIEVAFSATIFCRCE
jgi:hypothetical protein